jgi:16S rRNA (guanine966-N2)-methyltransferase
MRVIAGKYKGRRLGAVPDLSVRPVMDRVKQYIFDVIKDRCENATVCDIFAGSGALGIEAMSRGAAEVTFIDSGVEAVKMIEKNLAHIKCTERTQIFRYDALRFIESNTFAFDIVFCDPPYELKDIPKMVENVLKKKCVMADGILLVEHHITIQLPEKVESFSKIKEKKFGKTMITMYGRDDV